MEKCILSRKFLPSSSLGTCSTGLTLAFILLILLSIVTVKIQGPQANQTFMTNPFLSIPMILASLCAISAFFTGIAAIINYNERSILVFVSATMGFFILLFVLGEILYLH